VGVVYVEGQWNVTQGTEEVVGAIWKINQKNRKLVMSKRVQHGEKEAGQK